MSRSVVHLDQALDAAQAELVQLRARVAELEQLLAAAGVGGRSKAAAEAYAKCRELALATRFPLADAIAGERLARRITALEKEG